jgi:glycosyltransferase involved in cell wall biosynthesis
MVTFFNSYIDNKNIDLILLGDGSQLDECKKLVGGNKNIIFTGLVRNVKEYLQCADYYISYSVSEGMSMAVCEAVSCGLYPILSNIPSHHDVADVLQRDNCALIYNQIENLGSLMENMSETADKSKLHKYVDDNFSLKTMGRGYMKIYNEL